MPRITLKDLETNKAVTCAKTDALIGRDPVCALYIEGPSSRVVSAQHARIFYQDNAWWLQDVSRNGTVLDQERLIKGERHALRSGQVIGLGESGPRLRVETLDARIVAETVAESSVATSPRPSSPGNGGGDASPAAPRAASGEAEHSARRIEERTEPMKPAPDWVIQLAVRMTHTNQRIDVRGDVIRTGRSPECAIQIPPELGASVSRVHAEIAIQDGGVFVRDAGSRNGTFVNAQRIINAQPAHRGDVVMLGPGGPSFSLEDLRIVKGDPTPRGMPTADRARRGEGPLREPDTEPPVGESVIDRMLRGIGKAFGK